eukprot:gene14296-20274_t
MLFFSTYGLAGGAEELGRPNMGDKAEFVFLQLGLDPLAVRWGQLMTVSVETLPADTTACIVNASLVLELGCVPQISISSDTVIQHCPCPAFSAPSGPSTSTPSGASTPSSTAPHHTVFTKPEGRLSSIWGATNTWAGYNMDAVKELVKQGYPASNLEGLAPEDIPPRRVVGASNNQIIAMVTVRFACNTLGVLPGSAQFAKAYTTACQVEGAAEGDGLEAGMVRGRGVDPTMQPKLSIFHKGAYDQPGEWMSLERQNSAASLGHGVAEGVESEVKPGGLSRSLFGMMSHGRQNSAASRDHAVVVGLTDKALTDKALTDKALTVQTS